MSVPFYGDDMEVVPYNKKYKCSSLICEKVFLNLSMFVSVFGCKIESVKYDASLSKYLLYIHLGEHLKVPDEVIDIGRGNLFTVPLGISLPDGLLSARDEYKAEMMDKLRFRKLKGKKES